MRKDLTHGLKQNAVVPTYVLEYLLGQHCATDNEDVIQAGLESVQRILAKHYVHRNQAELVKSTIKERGSHKVIDKLTVELNEKGGFYEASFTNLGLKSVPVFSRLRTQIPEAFGWRDLVHYRRYLRGCGRPEGQSVANRHAGSLSRLPR